MKRVQIFRKQYCLIAILFITTVLKAQSPAYFVANATPVQGVSAIESAALTINTVDKTRNATETLIEESLSGDVYIRLDFGDDYVQVNTPNEAFNVTIGFNLICGTSNIAKSITVTQLKPEALIKVNLLTELVNGATSISLSNIVITTDVNGVAITGASTPANLLQEYVKNNVRLSASLVRTYKVDVRVDDNGTERMANALAINQPVSISNRLVTFTWNSNTASVPLANQVRQYPNYEIHILKVENTDPTENQSTGQSVSNDNSITTHLDWSKALKVETQSSEEEVKLTIAEGTGYYVWRVRPIGNFYEGGIANSQNYGLWSYSAPDGTPISLNKASLPLHAFYFTDPDENINWIYNRVFTEGDNIGTDQESGFKVKEGINYADNLLRAKQSQAYNSSNNTTLVTQSVNDYSGRPSMTTLPVPVAGGLSGYKEQFVKPEGANNTYTAADFDTDANFEMPAKVEDDGTDFAYYSNNAGSTVNNDFVPSADGYAFQRTIFKNDGSGRVAEASGVGKVHSLAGALEDGNGKTTTYKYSTATDVELIRLFGDEAPLAESVIKTTVTDPNGEISITYTSKEGKTIATALSSINTDNLLALDNTNSVTSYTNTSVANQNTVSGNNLVSSKRVVIPHDDTPVKLAYHLSGLPAVPCSSIQCTYALKIHIVELSSGETYTSDSDGNIANGITPFEVSEGSDLDFTTYPSWNLISANANILTPESNKTDVIMDNGEYMFIKELTSTNDEDNVADAVNANHALYKPLLDALAGKMRNTQTETEMTAFQDVMMALTTTLSAYQQSTITPEQATTAVINILDLDVNSLPGTTNYIVPADFSVTSSPSPESKAKSIIEISMNTDANCGGCGPIQSEVPMPSRCFTCDGDYPENIETPATSYLVMKTENEAAISLANANDQIAEVPYGFNDFKTTSDFNNLFNDPAAQRAAIDHLVDYYFIRELMLKLIELNPIAPLAELPEVAPGFTMDKLKFMLSNMLISKYYTGKAKLDGSDWKVLNDDGTVGAAISSLTIDNNYDCEELYNSWIAAVSLIGSFEQSEDTNVVDEYNDRDGGGQGQKEANDGDNWEDVKRRHKKKLKKKLGKEMEDFSNSSDGQIPKAKMKSLTNLIANFMRGAGYEFAAVIDGDPLPGYVVDVDGNNIPDDFEALTLSAPLTGVQTINIDGVSYTGVPFIVDNGSFYSNTCNGSNYNSLEYPYMLKPEWMFKYFMYNVHSGNNTNVFIDDSYPVIPNQVMHDIQNCYNPIDKYIAGTGSITFCEPPSCGADDYHENWDAATRLSFYNAIKFAPACFANKGVAANEDYIDQSDLPTCETKEELIVEANALADTYAGNCEDQRENIKANLIAELEAACYTIEACQSPSGASGVVTMKQIDIMVDEIVTRCSTEVAAVKAKLPTHNGTSCTTSTATGYGCDAITEYPTCVQTGCENYVLVKDGSLRLESSRRIEVTLFADCDEQHMLLFSDGEFLPHIDPISGCTNADKEWMDMTNCSVHGADCEDGYDCEATGLKYGVYSEAINVNSAP